MKRMAMLVAAAFVIVAIPAGAATLITSKQIRNGTIRTVDISSKTKRALKGNQGERGPQGPQGPAGPSGAAAALGKIVRVQSPELTIFAGDIDGPTATCPSGYALVSGGYDTIGADTEVFFADDFGSRNSWSVGVDNFDSSIEATAVAIAYCAPSGKAVSAARHIDVDAKVDRLVARQLAAHR